MAGKNEKSGNEIKRRRIDDSLSKLFAHKHKNTSNNEYVQQHPLFTERHFWKLSLCIILVWIIVRVFDFSLVPLSYKGLYINRPYDGLHSWHFTNQAWAARSHAKYGLSYTKGYRTLSVGDPPTQKPEYYVSHPPLETLISAIGILIFGTQEWAIRLFELILSIPAMLLTIYFLSKLFSCSVALGSGLLLVIIPVFSYFALEYLWVLIALWALYRYLILTDMLKNRPQPKKRYFFEMAIEEILRCPVHLFGE